MKKTNNQGQSFIELIAALLIVSFVLVALVTLVTKSIANTAFSRNKALATSYTQQGIEWLRGERDKDWATFYAKTANPWCIVSLNWASNGSHQGSCSAANTIPGTPFIRTITFIRTNSSTVDATIMVSWSDGNGTHQSVSTTTFTNWKGNS